MSWPSHAPGASRSAARASAPAPDRPVPIGLVRLSLSPRLRVPFFVLYAVLLVAIGWMLLMLDFRIDAPEIRSFDEAVLVSPAGEVREPLPHRCVPRGSGADCARTLRVSWTKPADDPSLFSLYLPHFLGGVRVRLNGTLIAASQWSRSTFVLGADVPILVPLPTPLLHEGGNTLEFILESDVILGSQLGPFHIGPDRLLRPYFDQARILNATLPRIFDGWLLSVGFMALLIWALRPWDRLYFHFGLTLTSLAVTSLPAILGSAMNDTLLVCANMSRYLGGVMILPFVWQFVGRTPPVRTRYFLLLPLLGYAGALTLPLEGLAWLSAIVMSPIVLALMLVAIAEIARSALRRRSDSAALMLGALILLLVMLLHDVCVQLGLHKQSGVLLARYGGAVVIGVTSALLLWRFAAALNLQEQFSDRLRRSVAAAEARLEESFARERVQTRKAAMEAERVRIMSDLHDGIGGHLVSILSLSTMRREQSIEAIAGASRRALDDMRIVVTSLQDVGEDLTLMLTNFRERIEPELRHAAIRLSWRPGDLPELPGLNPTVVLAIFRILQEAVNNAVRHSASGVLEIESGPSPAAGYGARFVVRDFGCGGAAARAGGFGLRNMERRAASIGARLAIRSGGDGTTVILDLPERIEADPSMSAAAPASPR